ncbi:DUF4419 domain-containing protein [Kitasatospora sp. NPDC127111]|uniref:DUF4419 domain-containing protein n=1 Tax=Kitasatospora sp. NPDC127111 TaxID=3345363 RepID=UPI0036411A28
MIIELPLAETTRDRSVGEPAEAGNEGFLAAVVGGEFRIHHRSAATLLEGEPHLRPEESEPTWSLLLRAAHLAFAGHLPLSLSPDVLWYAVVHEVAVHVRLDPDRYAGLFGGGGSGGRGGGGGSGGRGGGGGSGGADGGVAGKRSIEVRDDRTVGPDADWSRSIRLVREPLEKALGADLVELFQPVFSTTTPDDVCSVLVALMDVVSPYYEFTWITMCGIPRIRLEGTAEDWRLLARRVGELAETFGEGLRPWFAGLLPVLRTVADTAAGGAVDEAFWRSLSTLESRSGGDRVSGWITAFFAHRQGPSGPRPRTSFDWRDEEAEHLGLNDFPSHVSRVPFRWKRLGEELDMAFVAGVLGIERDAEGFVRPRLGHAVLEVLRAAPDPAEEQAALAAVQLPAGWTIERVREVAGIDTPRLLGTDRQVVDVRERGEQPLGPPFSVLKVWDFFCLIRLVDGGEWYVGMLDPRSGDVMLEGRLGTDLGEAVWRLLPR